MCRYLHTPLTCLLLPEALLPASDPFFSLFRQRKFKACRLFYGDSTILFMWYFKLGPDFILPLIYAAVLRRRALLVP